MSRLNPYGLDRTVGDALRMAAAEFDPKTALIDGEELAGRRRRWTFVELLADAAQIARALFVRLEPGEHIAIWSPNSPGWVLSEFSAALAGMTLVTVNPAFQSKELAYVLGQSRSVGLIVAPAYGITILSGGSGGGAGRFSRGGGFSGGGGRSAGGSASGN